MITDQLTTFSFLTTGPNFALRLASDFHPVPKLSSPLLIHDSFGARSVYFIPASLDAGVSRLDHLGQLEGRDGRLVDLYRRPEEPPQWWLRWSLTGGFIYTFLEEQDGSEYASTVCAALAIHDADQELTTPFLFPNPPLRPAVAPFIGYLESASFQSNSGLVGMSVRRPGFLEEGKTMVRNSGGEVRLRAGAKFGCELSIAAGSLDEATTILDIAMDSITEQ